MQSMLFFALSLVIPMTSGLLVTRYLGPVLGRVLTDLCGTRERADFWVRICMVLLVALPLFLVLLVSPGRVCRLDAMECAVNLIRGASFFTVIGLLLGVWIIASMVRRYLPKPGAKAHTESLAPAPAPALTSGPAPAPSSVPVPMSQRAQQ
ncbi:hypothetical protein [Pandoraea norimbergensis]|uniref:Uncharacterized protein n=1 Tax=Pandoraea norimbergensis TaxID=93219 RepID=A0ABM5WKS3_9BURK|nr:hypothetical protein [Pandoraea norimbergensis]ALS61093.1 hypothetical protein AT302_16260 [Pandoraea norimbergensis]